MSKKYALLFMTLFLTAAGAFYYEGAPQDVKATEEKPSANTETDAETDGSKTADIAKESDESEVKVEEKSEAASSAPDNPDNKDTQQKAADQQQETAQKEDTIIIDGRVYENIMNEEKFAHMSGVASRHGAVLYALPETDMFVIVKNGEIIVQMSTGTKAASTEYAGILSELFSAGFDEYKKIQENILFAAETNANVRVDFGDYIAYSITVAEGRIRVTW
ncbi:hypothetical protein [Bacillus infantis]|jgi:hypothetical protein|uniref:hypothetical protein n=1 Tax=Bacillus infantis TaxID=324767 RepID=UPI0021551CE0|nr:hypothetical protein [Bacillus infantis]MCR6612803.1 hypothetical protein [Bacillus infantis]